MRYELQWKFKYGPKSLQKQTKEYRDTLWSDVTLFIQLGIKSKYFKKLSGGSLESPQWLLLAFCPKILGGGRDLRIVVLLEKECTFSDADNVRGGDTQILLDGGKIFKYYALTGGGDAKNFPSSPALALAPHMSHLVKRSLPNILFFVIGGHALYSCYPCLIFALDHYVVRPPVFSGQSNYISNYAFILQIIYHSTVKRLVICNRFTTQLSLALQSRLQHNLNRQWNINHYRSGTHALHWYFPCTRHLIM